MALKYSTMVVIQVLKFVNSYQDYETTIKDFGVPVTFYNSEL